MKYFLFSGVISGLLFPLVLFFFYGQTGKDVLSSDMRFGIGICLVVAIDGGGMLWALRKVAETYRLLGPMVMRLGAAVAATAIFSAEWSLLLHHLYPSQPLDWSMATLFAAPVFISVWLAAYVTSIILNQFRPKSVPKSG